MTTTGDGIIAALQVLEEMKVTGKALSELIEGMAKYPQLMKNVKLPQQIDITANETINTAVKDVEQMLGKSGRVVLRPSGTEPLVRVMVEGENKQQVEQLVDQLTDKVREVVTKLH